MKARDLTLISVLAAVMAVCAWIAIPAAVSFTMQVFGVFCALFLLGGKRGFFAVLVYVLLGAIGLPVFSGFGGGFGVLLGPTGGFILSFPAAALVMWALENRLSVIWSAAAALALIYITGTVWFWLFTGGSLAPAILVCAAPYILPDAAKLALAYFAAGRLKKTLKI